MNAPRIAFLGFHAGPGGIGRVMANLVNALVDAGATVDVLLNRADAADRPLLAPEVRVIELGGRKGWRTVRPLARYLEQERPDTLVTNKEWANQAATLARGRAGVPVRLVFRVGTTGSVALARRPGPKRWLRRQAMRYCYRRADAVIAVSAGVAEDTIRLTGIDRERVHVVHNPSIPSDLETRATVPVDHSWLGDPTVPVVLGVGRLVEPKDFPTLLRAFARVRAERPCRLVLLGEGPKRSELEGLARELGVAEAVDLPGYADNPYAWMRRAALFVLASSREGFPNVLAEALAVGTPVVATDCPSGPREILQGGDIAPLVPVGDTAALAEAITATLDAPPKPASLRAAAERFTGPHAARAYLEVLAPEQA